MANLDMPKGFECKGVPLRVNEYTAGAVCYPGDLVILQADGKVDPAAAGTEILGLAMNYASADGQKVLVADHPDQLLIGQADETEIDAQTDIGSMCDILATAGNSTYKASRQEIDSSTVVDTTAQVQILSVVQSPNNALGGFVDVVLRINEHQFGDSNAGSGA